MKNVRLSLLLLSCLGSSLLFAHLTPLTDDFVFGDPGIESMSAITFGPEGILFIGDSQTAHVIAVATQDDTRLEVKEIGMQKVDEQIAAVLGAAVADISILDMAVSPVSNMIYLAVEHTDGTQLLLKTDGEKFMAVPLKEVKYSKTALRNPVAVDAKDKRGRTLRPSAISDIQYRDGQLMVTGLSNEEFGSTFRVIPFPFKKEQMHSTLEIYHAAHGRYETHAPVKTFLPTEIDGKPYVVAAYTCTPMVLFPMDELKAGEHTKGKTVAELGNWNAPLDIIRMDKDGEGYLLMANSSRALMKISLADLAAFEAYLTEPVEERSGTAGVDFIALPFVNVLQLDRYGDQHFLMLQRKSNGQLDLYTSTDRWL